MLRADDSDSDPEDPDAVYEVEQLVGKREVKIGRSRVTTVQYLVKRKGWGHEYNEWKKLADLSHSQRLIDEYEGRAGKLPAKTKGRKKAAAPRALHRPQGRPKSRLYGDQAVADDRLELTGKMAVNLWRVGEGLLQ